MGGDGAATGVGLGGATGAGVVSAGATPVSDSGPGVAIASGSSFSPELSGVGDGVGVAVEDGVAAGVGLGVVAASGTASACATVGSAGVCVATAASTGGCVATVVSASPSPQLDTIRTRNASRVATAAPLTGSRSTIQIPNPNLNMLQRGYQRRVAAASVVRQSRINAHPRVPLIPTGGSRRDPAAYS